MFNPYDENRRFDHVYPDYATFNENISQLILFNYESLEADKQAIYLRLSLEYGSSFFRYERNGTIYAKTAEFVNNVLPLYERIRFIEMQIADIDRIGLGYNETSYFETDNTSSDNIDGYEVNKTITKNTNFNDLNTINQKLLSLRLRLTQQFNKFQNYLLNDIIYVRGDIYEN